MEYKDDRIYEFGFRASVGAGSAPGEFIVFVYELPVGDQRSEIVAFGLSHIDAAKHVQQLTYIEMQRRERIAQLSSAEASE
jgi:hypothetical protein